MLWGFRVHCIYDWEEHNSRVSLSRGMAKRRVLHITTQLLSFPLFPFSPIHWVGFIWTLTLG